LRIKEQGTCLFLHEHDDDDDDADDDVIENMNEHSTILQDKRRNNSKFL